jgi:hypothetical protein
MAKKRPDPNRPRRWQAILRRIPMNEPWVGAEIGVWMGRTAQEVLSARPMLRWIMVDAWTAPDPESTYAKSPDRIAQNDQRYFDDCYAKTVRAVSRYRGRIEIIRDWSAEAAMKIEDASLDICFIDSDHSYEGVKADTLRWLPKVREGGVLSWHDVGNLPRFPGVERAIDEVVGLENIERDGDSTGFYTVPDRATVRQIIGRFEK